jgi:8-oxo-dGTP diphosphatase
MIHHPNYRVSVEIILKKNDKILLTKRSEKVSVAPGVWNVPAGKVKFHEIPIEAAFREVKEIQSVSQFTA